MIITELRRLAAINSTELAEILMDAHITAPRNSAMFSPVAQWLEQFVEQPMEYIAVTEDNLYVITTEGVRHRYDLPPSIQHFVAQFNAGEYPELEGVPYDESPSEGETSQET